MTGRNSLVWGYILDLDGTLYRGEKAIPGAPQAVVQLRARGRRICFVSNNPLGSREAYARKLSSLGIPAEPEDVVTSGWVAACTLARQAPQARVLVLGPTELVRELRGQGLHPASDGAKADVVLVGFDQTLTYERLTQAFQALRRGATFAATNADPTCPVEDGEVPDAGAIIAALEACSGRKVEQVFGKPSPYTAVAALDLLKLPPQACAVVGDRLETDVRMAKENGMVSVLTLTGVTRAAQLARSPVIPDHVIASTADLAELDNQLNPRS